MQQNQLWGVSGLIIERRLRGTTGWCRTLLLVAAVLVTPWAIGLGLAGRLVGPLGVLMIRYLSWWGFPG